VRHRFGDQHDGVGVVVAQ
jgi:hypothetical protein